MEGFSDRWRDYFLFFLWTVGISTGLCYESNQALLVNIGNLLVVRGNSVTVWTEFIGG